MTEQQKKQITELRKNGMSYNTIADAVSLSLGTVKAFCSRHAIEHRPDSKPTGCKRCGDEIINTPGHRQRIFCSAECQRLYWREHPELMNHTAIIQKRCPACGKEFSDYRDHSRKYCSHACYITDRYGKGESNEPERIDLPCDDEAVSENA